jgi:hypothetical protein
MSNSTPVQIPRNLLFRYRFPLQELATPTRSTCELGEEHRIPSFGKFEGQVAYADWRGGWSEHGLNFSVEVKNKERSLWCKPNQLLESDSLQIWIDTRDTNNVHRATRYCHWFVAMPSGGSGKTPGMGMMLKINRAKEDSPSINRAKMLVESQLHKDGYSMQLQIGKALLNGWDPAEHRLLGFQIASFDQEFGWQTFSVGNEMPFAEDPSLWGTAELRGRAKSN